MDLVNLYSMAVDCEVGYGHCLGAVVQEGFHGGVGLLAEFFGRHQDQRLDSLRADQFLVPSLIICSDW